MAGTATTIEEQIVLLKNRGMEIEDEKKAAECLLDIGYFRLLRLCIMYLILIKIIRIGM